MNSHSFTELLAGFWHRAPGISVHVYVINNLKLTLAIAEWKHRYTKTNNKIIVELLQRSYRGPSDAES